ncbi:MAG: polyphosphate kinase 1 [Betaproteobacteria bacterium]|nr:polyphosphate kinase 1 [Betaproteobacteria bacterium]
MATRPTRPSRPATTSAGSKARERFLNREIQLLAFNRRVLAQAEDATVPVLERLKFLSILSSNLDEFFEIRVAGLKEQLKLNAGSRGPDGFTPRETFRRVAEEVHALVIRQYVLLNDEMFPALAAEGIRFLRRAQWTPKQQAWVKDYFFREMMPVLTPIGLDPAHPFPRVFNKSLNFAVELTGRDAFGRDSQRAIVQAPRVLPRVIKLPPEVAEGENHFIFLTSILHQHVGELFAGMEVLGCYQFRVTRNSDLFVDEEEIKNLRLALQGELPQRHLGDAVRLEVADNCSEEMVQFLSAQFDLDEIDIYRVNGPVNLVRLMSVPDQVARPDLKFPPFVPGLPKPLVKVAKGRDVFDELKKHDILLHHPFESFTPVIEFIQQAARDPQVVAIKQTVYRTGTDSVIMETLIEAAKHGKEVTVVVELMARFDEEANLNWASRLEEVGAHVVYGVVGHKTHAKMALVVRRELDDPEEKSSKARLRRYVHLGTGNYHPRTARLYTDFGLMTANEGICGDVNDIFVQLTGLGKATKLAHVWQAPFTLHAGVLASIENEIRIAKSGKRAHIIAKMNSLLEPQAIEALYRASRAGVKIDLIVRGVCALRPGVPGLSDNIRVRSIVGRFLEHSRIFYFRNGGAGNERVMLSSADWMERNFFRRIELCFPVNDPRLKKRVIAEGLKPYLDDNAQAWEMDGEGGYTRKRPAKGVKVRRIAQEELLKLLSDSSIRA